MIFITGDVHCPTDLAKLNRKHFQAQKQLTKQDYLIVCGDMGIVWANPQDKGYREDLYWQKWFDTRNYTTLYLDGNHENHALLASYPVVDFCGGKAHQIKESVYHLMRGEIYKIDGKTFFTFGGASSHDKHLRTAGKNWWAEEVASLAEMKHGTENLSKVNHTVDYILTHCCGSEIQDLFAPQYEKNEMTAYFQFLNENIAFQHWYFGHYHIDQQITPKHTCVYDRIISIF